MNILDPFLNPSRYVPALNYYFYQHTFELDIHRLIKWGFVYPSLMIFFIWLIITLGSLCDSASERKSALRILGVITVTVILSIMLLGSSYQNVKPLTTTSTQELLTQYRPPIVKSHKNAYENHVTTTVTYVRTTNNPHLREKVVLTVKSIGTKGFIARNDDTYSRSLDAGTPIFSKSEFPDLYKRVVESQQHPKE